MILRLRLYVVMARPPVLVLLALFTAVGLAQAGHGEDRLLVARALAVVIGFLLFSVAVNDIADAAIDRVNLPGDWRRPLVTGAATRRDLVAMGGTAAAVALAACSTLPWPVVVVTAAGLLVSAGYSLRPVRLADRGMLASLVLPACYVAVPYLVGLLAAQGSARPRDLALLGALYLGFIGRILLKDFRDVRGDALFGKRTFLVRHGRRWTCTFSAGCWITGTVVLLMTVARPTAALVGLYAACLAAVLVLLYVLSAERGPRRDETLTAAVAIIARGMIVMLFAHLSMAVPVWSAPVWSALGRAGLGYDAAMLALAIVTAGQVATMVRRGPRTRTTITTPSYSAHRRRSSQLAPMPGTIGSQNEASRKVRTPASTMLSEPPTATSPATRAASTVPRPLGVGTAAAAAEPVR